VLGLLASSLVTQAVALVTLQWDPSPDTNVVRYVVYSGINAVGKTIQETDVGTNTTATITNKFGGTTNFYFVVCYDAEGAPSAPSEVVLASLPGPYAPPTISAIADQVIMQNGATDGISVAVNDEQFPATELILDGTSSNPELVPDSSVFVEGSDANRTVTVTPPLGQFGSAIITLTVDDGVATGSERFVLKVNPVIPAKLLYLPLEAEAAELASPMVASPDLNAGGGQYIGSATPGSGRASFTVNIPFASSYVVWCRVMSPESGPGSFVVSADDGREDVYQIAPRSGTNDWQWIAVNGRGTGSGTSGDGLIGIDPRVFPLAAGRHTFTFQGLEADTALDQVLITNDPDYVPTGILPAILLTVPAPLVVDESTALVTTITATVPALPATGLTFSLADGPSGMTIDPNTGLLLWTPTEAQGPGTNLVTVQVTANVSPPMSVSGSFTVMVREVNVAPVLTPPPNLVIDELATLVIANTVVDPDLPPNQLTFSLVTAPNGMTINPDTGILIWKPTEAQGPSTNLITLRVSDNGSPSMSDTVSFTVVVKDVNSPPNIDPVAPQIVRPGALLRIAISASDTDLPRNSLSFSLGPDAPAGATIDPATGVFTWTPTASQAEHEYSVTVRVADNGSPGLSNSTTFSVRVKLAPITLTPLGMIDQQFHLRATGDPGISYSLLASTNFVSWISLSTVESPGAVFELVDTNASAFPFRFYRVVAGTQ
jgi:hypothetical protein